MKIWKKICVNLFALLVRKLINCRYLKDIFKKNENKRTFWQRQFAPVQTKPSIWMQSRTHVTAPISNYKKIVVHYIKQTSRSDILISFLVHCFGTFFFHCLPSFTHNYEGRHEEASLPIASSRCRSNLSDWRSESEEIKSPVVKIPPLSVFEDDDLFFWDFFFILWFIQTDWLSFLFLA